MADDPRQGLGLRRALEVVGRDWMKHEDARREISKVYPPGQAAHHAEFMRFTAWRSRLPAHQRNRVTMADLPKLRGPQPTMQRLIERGAEALAYEVLRNNARFEYMTDEDGVRWVRQKRTQRKRGRPPRKLTPEEIRAKAEKSAKTRKERYGDKPLPLSGAAAATPEQRSEMMRRAHQTRIANIRAKAKDELRHDPEFLAQIKAELRAEIEQEVERQRAESRASGHR